MVLMDTDWCMSYNTLLQIRTHFSTNLCILNWHHSNFSTKSMVGVGMPWIGVPTTAQYVDTDLCPNVRWSFKKSDFFFFWNRRTFYKTTTMSVFQSLLRMIWFDVNWMYWVYWWLVEMIMVILVQKSLKSAYYSLFYGHFGLNPSKIW